MLAQNTQHFCAPLSAGIQAITATMLIDTTIIQNNR